MKPAPTTVILAFLFSLYLGPFKTIFLFQALLNMSIDDALKSELISAACKGDITRFVVGAVIMRGEKVLLLRRPQDDFMGGIYELPSGGVEIGETLIAALSREIEEETGLRIEGIRQYVGSFDYESGSGRATRQFNFLTAVSEPLDIRLTEHDDYLWADREELESLLVSGDTRRAIASVF